MSELLSRLQKAHRELMELASPEQREANNALMQSIGDYGTQGNPGQARPVTNALRSMA